jgi:serine/threonine protein kinase/tetratricopeptide (TPR) repeat protein
MESNMGHHVGQRLGNYRLLRLLGQGGFAKAYLGEQIYLHTQAALKVLHVQLLDGHVQAFLKEARLIAHLEHPRIVQVHDFAVQEGTPFLVMSYAPHGSIRRLYPEGTVLDAGTVLSYVRDIAEALQFAHDHGLIHRDVKPENMLVSSDKRLLLGDFGLAVAALGSQQKGAQDIVGTVFYMAPEQLEGRPCAASDQYALGVVAYEWLCGVLPFVGTHREVAGQHIATPPMPLREKNSAISPAIEKVVQRSLNKDPQQRFPSVAAFALALEQAVWSSELEQEELSSATTYQLSYPVRQQQRPLVGREKERTLLHRLILGTEQCAGISSSGVAPANWTRPDRVPCAFLLGEAGIGKTRLAEEASHEAHQRGWSVVWSRLYSHECRAPYQLWVEVLRAILRQGLWGRGEDDQRPLFFQPLAALLPELADNATPLQEPSEHEQLRLWEAVLALLIKSCERQPILLVLDDVHWADSGSCELLGYLIRRLIDYPFLIVGTYREHEVSAAHPLMVLVGHLQREHTVEVAHVTGLTDAQIGELVAEVPEPFNKYIQRQAVGNPFFAEELALLSYDAKASLDKPALVSSLPETITAVLQQRLNKLSNICRNFLAQMAVLGSSFAFSTMQFMTSSGNTMLGEEQLLNIIDEALQERVLMEEMRGGGDIMYHFWHPLLMSHLYETLSATRRALLHRKAAEILRQMYAKREIEGAALVVHHLLYGGADASSIARYAELAGHHAYALATYLEAEQYYRLALKYGWGCEGENLCICQTMLDDVALLAYLLELLGECTRFQGKYLASRRCYERILELHDALEKPVAGMDLLKEMQLQAMFQCEIGVTWYDVEDGTNALRCYRQSEQILEAAGISDGHALAHIVLQQSYVYWRNGSYELARDSVQRALELFQSALQRETQWKIDMPAQPTRLRRTLAGDPVNLGRIYALQGMIANSVGQVDASLEHFQQALAVYEQYHCQREIGLIWCDLGDVYIRKTDYKMAEIVSRRALRIAEQVGEIPTICIVYINLGLLASRSGNLVEARALYQRGLLLAEQGDDQVHIGLVSTYLALVAQELGAARQARQHIRRALTANKHRTIAGPIWIACAVMRLARFSSSANNHMQICEADRGVLRRARKTVEKAFAFGGLDKETYIEGEIILARILLLLGKATDAQHYARQALESAQHCGLMGSVAQAQRVLGSILASQAHYEEAEQNFKLALLQFAGSGMRLDYARTLYCYGRMLISFGPQSEQYQRGASYLREARSICLMCQANLELQYMDGDLLILSDTQTPQHA